MSDHLVTLTCQRCGAGFVLGQTYRDLLQRREILVITPPQCPTCFIGEGPLPKERGQIKWFSSQKHYGFIVTQDGMECFVHERQLLGDSAESPQKGQQVRFHVHYPVKGPEALNVELLSE